MVLSISTLLPATADATRSHADLLSTALRVREHCVRMSANGGCFLGSALSCVDLVTYLYGRVLRISPETDFSGPHDTFLLSKGHAVPAWYGVLVERGFIPARRLDHYLLVDDRVYLHPHSELPGVEFHSGSLGHALSVGLGIAWNVRSLGGDERVYVMVGDGELNEGSVWESVLVAASLGLRNLVLIVDRNRFQANQPTEALAPLEPLAEKFLAFGWDVRTCDGHAFPSLAHTFAKLAGDLNLPTAIIAHTVRGKGLPSIEAMISGWFVSTDAAALPARLGELRQNAPPGSLG